ncbi:MAG: hypothetical protein LQ338_005075 [Usnochroma carphineum]|nr:MAG: hypothetical protein LQ338_005075 [Usnochroma carphineum]
MPGDWKRGPKEDILGLEDPPPSLSDMYTVNAPKPRAGRRGVEELLPYRIYMRDEDPRTQKIDRYIEERRKKKEKVVFKSEEDESLNSKTKGLSLGPKIADGAVKDARKMDIDPKDNDG